MKRIIIVFSIMVIVALTTGCDTLSPPTTPKASGGAVISQQNTGIWVTGEGEVTVTPDLALLNLGVEAQADTVASARQQAANAMDAINRELESQGVAGKDIQTRQYSIQPVRRYVPETQQEALIGYRVTNTVMVKVRDVGNTGLIIDAVTAAGGDYIRIDSISFTVDDPSVYNEEARKQAMADARAKAGELADLARVRLGRPTYISESGGYTPPPPIVYRAEMPVPAPMVATPINPGETEVRLTVQVAYSID